MTTLQQTRVATPTRTLADTFDRITQVPGVMGGKPCIRGMRVTVGMIVGQFAECQSVEDILDAYPYLEPEDIHQSLQYAAWLDETKTRIHILPFSSREL
jgi:uncharacterized protein (DUF433 family)